MRTAEGARAAGKAQAKQWLETAPAHLVMAEIMARLMVLEEWVLGNLTPVDREKYQMRLVEEFRRRGVLSQHSGPG